MDKHYLLPIGAVVEMMRGSPDIMMLQASLSSLPGVSKETCFAQLVLGQGQVSCTITASKSGLVLSSQQKAYQAIEQCGDLLWSLLPVPSTNPHARPKDIFPPVVAPAGPYLSPIPTLRKALTPDVLALFSPLQRRVLMLVDGKRTIEEIARLLNKEQMEVQQILAALPHLIHF